VEEERLICNPLTSFPNNEPTDVGLGIKPKSTILSVCKKLLKCQKKYVCPYKLKLYQFLSIITYIISNQSFNN